MKKKERAKRELALGRPSQQSRVHKTLRPPDLCRKQKTRSGYYVVDHNV